MQDLQTQLEEARGEALDASSEAQRESSAVSSRLTLFMMMIASLCSANIGISVYCTVLYCGGRRCLLLVGRCQLGRDGCHFIRGRCRSDGRDGALVLKLAYVRIRTP